MQITFRHDDTMIAVASCPAVVAFQDILDKMEVVVEDCHAQFRHTLAEQNWKD